MSIRRAMPSPSRARPNRPPAAGARGGIVLFVVMVVIVMMSLAGLSFVLMMSTENAAVHLHGDELVIEQVAASGEELLKAYSRVSAERRRRALGFFESADLLRGVLVIDDERGGHRARFSLLSPRIEEDRIDGFRFGPGNESARLNLAVLPQWETEYPGAAREALMNLPGMTEPIAEALLDWIDADDAPRAAGAEAAYYAGLGVPYGPRNGVPTSLEELLLVRDVSRELLFGADLDMNYHVDETEQMLASTGSGIGPVGGGLPWASLLTVYSAERNVDSEGRPRIHLNQSDLAELHEQLSDAFEPGWANFIITYRQLGPRAGSTEPEAGSEGARSLLRRGMAPLRTIARPHSTGSDENAWSEVEVDFSLPAAFEIDSVLDLVGVEIELVDAEATGSDADPEVLADDDSPSSEDEEPVVLESPFPLDRSAMEDYLPALVDRTTVTSEKVLRGRVNVNEAPRAVLSALPGLDASQVDQIIAARDLRLGAEDSGRRQVTWLLTEGIVDMEAMKRLLALVTTGGDVFRAQVVAFFDDAGPTARADVVVDGTVSPPRRVYWKDLRLLGRGYSPETLGAKSPTAMSGVAGELENSMPLGPLD